MTPTDDYYAALEASKRFHGSHKAFNGRFLFRYMDDVKAIIDEFGCRTMLDYGCGKGAQYQRPLEDHGGVLLEEWLGVNVTKYDPAWPPFAAEPSGKFDLVVCTQVLGSVPIADLPWIVDRLYGFARKAVYVGERLKDDVRKGLHRDMAAKMPQGWTHGQWANVLRRTGSGIAGFLRTKDDRLPKDSESARRIERLQ